MTETRPDLAIIDAKTAAAVQARFEETRTTYARKGRRVPQHQPFTHPLSGLLHCAECGTLLSIGGGETGRRYYACPAAKRGTCTLRRYLREGVIREGIIREIRLIFDSPSGHALIREAVAAAMEAATSTSDQRKEIAARIKKAESRAQRLALVLADGDAPSTIVETIRELERQVRTDRAALERLDATPTNRKAPEPEEVLAGLTTALDGPPDVVRHQLRTLLAAERLNVVQRADGSVVVQGALDVGTILGSRNTKSTPLSETCSTVHCGGRI